MASDPVEDFRRAMFAAFARDDAVYRMALTLLGADYKAAGTDDHVAFLAALSLVDLVARARLLVGASDDFDAAIRRHRRQYGIKDHSFAGLASEYSPLEFLEFLRKHFQEP